MREHSPSQRRLSQSPISQRRILCLMNLLALALCLGAARIDAFGPCQISESLDIEIEIQRQGFYRQTAAGVQPDARAPGVFGAAPSPFSVEVTQDGLGGFGFPDLTFEGLVSFGWGSVNFEEPALNWPGHGAGFGSENELAAGAGAGQVNFRLTDAEVSFAFSFAAPAWSIPTPEFAAPAAGQVLDPSAPITFQWAQLTRNNATEATLFRIREEEEGLEGGNVVFASIPCALPVSFPGLVFMAPDATSITVPAGALTNRQARYIAELSITRHQGSRQGSAPVSWSADLSDGKSTVMPLTILGGSPGPSRVAPRITVQPSSQTVKEGDPVILSVSAEGTAPLTYRWKKDGVDIPGADDALFFILKAAPSDRGAYQAVVSNGEGSIASDAAILSVDSIAPPVLVNARLQVANRVGGGLILTAVPSQSGSLVLQISSDLIRWTPWRTQQVASAAALTLPIEPQEMSSAGAFFRSSPAPLKP